MFKINLAKYTALAIFVPIGFVMVLVAINRYIEASEKIHFTRNMISTSLKLLKKIDRPVNVTGFAALAGNKYCFKTTDPAVFFATDLNLNQYKFHKIFGIKPSHPSGSSFLYFNDSTVFLLDGNNGTITVSSPQTSKAHVFKLPVFTRAACISNQSFVLRSATVLNNMPDQVFIKANLSDKTIINENALSRFSGDAGISTDGLLYYDAATNSLVYVYYYSNEYICFDTSLNIRYKKVTIYPDTGYHISADGIGPSGNKIFTNIAASRVINWKCDANAGRLYINSPFIADNEVPELFKKNTVIDVYDISKATYLYSFYIPSYKKQKIEGFKVTGNTLLAIYQHDLILYTLSL